MGFSRGNSGTSKESWRMVSVTGLEKTNITVCVGVNYLEEKCVGIIVISLLFSESS
jgi:hypothetical protein